MKGELRLGARVEPSFLKSQWFTLLPNPMPHLLNFLHPILLQVGPRLQATLPEKEKERRQLYRTAGGGRGEGKNREISAVPGPSRAHILRDYGAGLETQQIPHPRECSHNQYTLDPLKTSTLPQLLHRPV